MINRLSYKHKCYFLSAGLLLFITIGYRFSFSDTVALAAAIKTKEEKLQWLKEKEKELPALRIKMEAFSKAWSKGDSTAVRDQLTASISDFAERHACVVTEIPVNSWFRQDNLHVQTNTFTVKGDFNSLLLLLQALENGYRYVSKIMSARFFSVQDAAAKKKVLYLTIITQSFEQKAR